MSTQDAAQRAGDAIAEVTGRDHHDIAVILGSGWDAVRDVAPSGIEVPYDQIPGFTPTTVHGHAGLLRSIGVGGHHVLLLSGRTHFYENRDADACVQSVRAARAAGCRTIILTNGSGALRPQWTPGTVVLISDHINLTAASPLTGDDFVDMTDAYSPDLRKMARRVDPDLPEGVYAQFIGPQFETPAEVRMAGTLGADLVGMSTALETICARAEGLQVLGLSLVTNPAAGISDHGVDHKDIVHVGDAAAGRTATLLMRILEEM